jgi:plastocyanin
MHIPSFLSRLTLPVGALLLVTACAGGTAAGWTYAPLGPSAPPSASASASAPASPSGSGGAGVTLTVETTQAAPIAFAPAELTATAGAQVTVNYMNNSNQPHNINFFNGPDNTAPSLAASEQGTGPNNPQTTSFTAPSQPGDYFFWCDVHTSAMTGTLHVQ